MIKATPPLTFAACAPTDTTTGACNLITPVPFGVRVSWGPPVSREYIPPLPPVAYQIDYYCVETALTESFETVVSNRKCHRGEGNAVCNFDERITIVTGLNTADVYYFRVVAETIIGDGEYSTTLTASPACANSFIPEGSTYVFDCRCIRLRLQRGLHGTRRRAMHAV